MPNLIIGIDPSGLRPKVGKKGWLQGDCGFCIIETDVKIVQTHRMNLFQVIENLLWYSKRWDCLVVVENPDKQPVFPHRIDRVSVNKAMRLNRDLGKNQAVASHIEAYAEWCGMEVKSLTPKQKGAKWTMEYFLTIVRLSGLKYNKENISQHEIDAFQLAFKYLPK